MKSLIYVLNIDREHDFDVIFGQLVLCRKLKWIFLKHSNDVKQQVETPGKLTIFVAPQTYLVEWRFKLECNGVSGPLLVMIPFYLSNRVQRVVLNGKMSKWTFVTAGVPQGSVLGLLFFSYTLMIW